MSSHLSLSLLRLVLARRLPLSALLRREHRHLTGICEACLKEWKVGRDGTDSPLPLPEVTDPPRRQALQDPPEEDRHVSYREIERRTRQSSRRKKQLKLARRQLRVLREHPPEEWPRVVESAVKRYRSRAFAELLIQEGQRMVRSRPTEAERLLSLVPLVLHWIPGAEGASWATETALRAAGWTANAQRIRGDLHTAHRSFARLRHSRRELPPSKSDLRAELAGLEAALRIDQRRVPQARRLLREAEHHAKIAGDREGQARTLLQAANLSLSLGRTEEAIPRLKEAADLLPPKASPHLLLSVAVGRVLALCDLERYSEADEVLGEFCASVNVKDETLNQGLIESLHGRIALGKLDYPLAETCFLEARESYLRAKRHFDAALVSLDLAQVYLESGRMEELEELALDLVPQFQARGVGRETLAALHLLAEAVKAQEVNRELLTQVRRRMKAATPTTPSPPST